MVDFRRLSRSPTSDTVSDPIKIFQALPKPEYVNDLWDTQAAALRAWYERRDERDLAIKLNTGSGKTLVGLLIGESVRRELRQPFLYLAPTRQLATQVVEKATEFGISAVAYQRGGGLPSAFLNAEAILVGSYHILFNGRTVFKLLGRGEPVQLGGIVLDDAHTSAATLRDIFSITVLRSEHEQLYFNLVGLFRSAFHKIHAAGRFDDMLAGREEGVMEVPHWSWLDHATAVREAIQSEAPDAFAFSFPLVRDHFPTSHALVSKTAFTVTPILPPVHVVPSFVTCQRRVFMSATLSDDGVLIRTFDASRDSISRPITTHSVAGLGERMILAPTLCGLSRNGAHIVARHLLNTVRNDDKGAVVIVPSESDAQAWNDVGEIYVGDAVFEAVDSLQRPHRQTRPVPILVNRYDGIDLPNDSCRLLILDGKPRGSNEYDLYRASVLQGLSSINIALAQRVEQGMGRGTRGAGDFCVVLLLGKDLVGWLGHRDTQQTLTPGTRAQVILGRDIAGHVKSPDEVIEAARQCLRRDREWQQTHAQRIAAAGETEAENGGLVKSGRVERRAFKKLAYGHFGEACDYLVERADDAAHDDLFRGWLLQLASRAAWLAKDGDRAERLQVKAYAMNPALTKPLADVSYQPVVRWTTQAARVVAVLGAYEMPSALLEDIDSALTDLHAAASANRFELAIWNLGRFLGLDSDRPESKTRIGPDNLWLGDNKAAFIIECKHQKTNPLNKEDHGQLRVSEKWFEQHYPDWESRTCVIHPNGLATPQSGAADSDALVLTFDALRRMTSAVMAVYRQLVSRSSSSAAREARAVELLGEHGLESHRIASEYLTPFRESDR
ncbi:MAG: DEAD/DEAH box helicase family protein [Gemmatimonadota bacterium]|nr:DEAD/DEAH box helicase family protein [Gemmatimonadota bacterium]